MYVRALSKSDEELDSSYENSTVTGSRLSVDPSIAISPTVGT